MQWRLVLNSVTLGLVASTVLVAVVGMDPVGATPAADEAQPERGSIDDVSKAATLTVRLRKTEFRPLEPIVVDIELENKTDTPIYVEASGSPYLVYDLHVTYDRNNRKREMPRAEFFNQEVKHDFGKFWTFKPHTVARQRLFANLAYDLTRTAGYYLTVNVRFYQPLEGRRLGFGTATAGPFEFEVVSNPEADPK